MVEIQNGVKLVITNEDANKCDKLLNKLVLDERKYDNSISEDAKILNYFKYMIRQKYNYLLGYYIDNNIVGYTFIKGIDKETALLDGLYVEEEYRNKGIATELITTAFEICKNNKIKFLDVNVMYQNKEAQSFYNKLGFVNLRIGLRKPILHSLK